MSGDILQPPVDGLGILLTMAADVCHRVGTVFDAAACWVLDR